MELIIYHRRTCDSRRNSLFIIGERVTRDGTHYLSGAGVPRVHVRAWTPCCLQSLFLFFYFFQYICNGAEWSKDRTVTQAAESVKWRPQQAYGSNQVLLSQPQTLFSTPKILTLTHR